MILTAVICGLVYVWGRATASDPTSSIRLALIVMAAIAVVLFILGINFGLQPVRPTNGAVCSRPSSSRSPA